MCIHHNSELIVPEMHMFHRPSTTALGPSLEWRTKEAIHHAVGSVQPPSEVLVSNQVSGASGAGHLGQGRGGPGVRGMDLRALEPPVHHAVRGVEPPRDIRVGDVVGRAGHRVGAMRMGAGAGLQENRGGGTKKRATANHLPWWWSAQKVEKPHPIQFVIEA